MNKTYNAGIIGIGSYIPENIITNKDLEKMVDTTDEWIVERTGIKERRIADKEMAASDLAVKAALAALDDSKVKPEQIELIIVSTVTPDMIFPSTACIVQDSIQANNAAAFDIEAACSGFIYGMTVAKQFIETGMYEHILVIGSEVLSRITNWKDRNTCVLFGDGAGAVVLGRVEKGMGILSTYLGADGGGSQLLKVEAGGSRLPTSLDTVKGNMHFMHMDGSEVFKFAVRIMVDASKVALEKAELTIDDVDLIIPHQANKRIIASARKRLKLSEDKVYMNVDRYGNMSSASIPIAMDEAYRNGQIKPNDLLVLVGFGGGLTWGSCTVRWSK